MLFVLLIQEAGHGKGIRVFLGLCLSHFSVSSLPEAFFGGSISICYLRGHFNGWESATVYFSSIHFKMCVYNGRLSKHIKCSVT